MEAHEDENMRTPSVPIEHERGHERCVSSIGGVMGSLVLVWDPFGVGAVNSGVFLALTEARKNRPFWNWNFSGLKLEKLHVQ